MVHGKSQSLILEKEKVYSGKICLMFQVLMKQNYFFPVIDS